jgi:hypothetical protein
MNYVNVDVLSALKIIENLSSRASSPSQFITLPLALPVIRELSNKLTSSMREWLWNNELSPRVNGTQRWQWPWKRHKNEANFVLIESDMQSSHWCSRVSFMDIVVSMSLLNVAWCWDVADIRPEMLFWFYFHRMESRKSAVTRLILKIPKPPASSFSPICIHHQIHAHIIVCFA